MPLTLLISASARADLLELWVYVAEDSSEQADRVLERVLEVAEKLGEWPEMGRARNELRVGIRSLVVGSHVLFYRVTENRLEVVRVLHGRRDVGAAF